MDWYWIAIGLYRSQQPEVMQLDVADLQGVLEKWCAKQEGLFSEHLCTVRADLDKRLQSLFDSEEKGSQ